jgi:hypothetical protein
MAMTRSNQYTLTRLSWGNLARLGLSVKIFKSPSRARVWQVHYIFCNFKFKIMALRKEDLKKFQKKNRLVVTNIEEDKTENTTNQILTLGEPVAKVVGTNPTDSGAEMYLENVVKVLINGTEEDETSDFGRFMKESRVEGDAIIYEGGMKLDVSKPNGRMVNGNFVITKAAKAWLCSVTFNKRGGKLVADNRAALSAAIGNLFSNVKTETPAAAPSITQKTEPKVEPVDKVGP